MKIRLLSLLIFLFISAPFYAMDQGGPSNLCNGCGRRIQVKDRRANDQFPLSPEHLKIVADGLQTLRGTLEGMEAKKVLNVASVCSFLQTAKPRTIPGVQTHTIIGALEHFIQAADPNNNTGVWAYLYAQPARAVVAAADSYYPGSVASCSEQMKTGLPSSKILEDANTLMHDLVPTVVTFLRAHEEQINGYLAQANELLKEHEPTARAVLIDQGEDIINGLQTSHELWQEHGSTLLAGLKAMRGHREKKEKRKRKKALRQLQEDLSEYHDAPAILFDEEQVRPRLQRHTIGFGVPVIPLPEPESIDMSWWYKTRPINYDNLLLRHNAEKMNIGMSAWCG